ncbi:hypothetical protein GALMADRAFT_1130139 [Galerina marginata CBS 339.88]|uniref:Uncharacterized protein n=1 Tax=Galerina marginata (strain CBS 339.88) TaxID=685588 RepID=A0A067SB12_GALM3|nr:hypothetical protein GALMADRAFT_1130139 [Galerina marginata CBS 339.88]
MARRGSTDLAVRYHARLIYSPCTPNERSFVYSSTCPNHTVRDHTEKTADQQRIFLTAMGQSHVCLFYPGLDAFSSTQTAARPGHSHSPYSVRSSTSTLAHSPLLPQYVSLNVRFKNLDYRRTVSATRPPVHSCFQRYVTHPKT